MLRSPNHGPGTVKTKLWLDLRAIHYRLRSLSSWVNNAHVLIMIDNTNAVFYINKQGGIRSPTLKKEAHLLMFCAKGNSHLFLLYIFKAEKKHYGKLAGQGTAKSHEVESSSRSVLVTND